MIHIKREVGISVYYTNKFVSAIRTSTVQNKSLMIQDTVALSFTRNDIFHGFLALNYQNLEQGSYYLALTRVIIGQCLIKRRRDEKLNRKGAECAIGDEICILFTIHVPKLN